MVIFGQCLCLLIAIHCTLAYYGGNGQGEDTELLSLISQLSGLIGTSGQVQSGDERMLPYPQEYPVQSTGYSYTNEQDNFQRSGGYSMDYGMQQGGYGTQQMQAGYGMQSQQQPQSGYGLSQMSGYGMPQQQQSSYGIHPQMSGYGMPQQQQSGYGMQQQQSGYGMQQQKQQKQKVYVPIVIKKKQQQKKKKIIAVYKGFYIPGGTQVFGKFKTLGDCKKACEITPTCFAADYNPSLKKCYVHSNLTACDNMRTHPSLVHIKKVPCDLLETPRGLITLGVQIFGGLEQKGINSLQDCVKKCATAGRGIAATQTLIAMQTCFGLDYDFATHKCYFHTNSALCPAVDIIPTPVQVIASSSTVNIILCPLQNV